MSGQHHHPPARRAPDLIVAEAMILANSTWACGWPNTASGIYAPGQHGTGVVRITRFPSMPVWRARVRLSTSLRRYTDLVNQWQITRWCKRQDWWLVAPFKPKDAELFSIIPALTRPTAPTTAFIVRH
jgi:hypothetical protein